MLGKNKKTNLLTSLVNRAKIINEAKKADFLELIPYLSLEQTEESLKIFLSAENEIKATKKEYKRKKSKTYADYIPKLNKAFLDAKKLINREEEAKSKEIDERNEEEMLNKLDNL